MYSPGAKKLKYMILRTSSLTSDDEYLKDCLLKMKLR